MIKSLLLWMTVAMVPETTLLRHASAEEVAPTGSCKENFIVNLYRACSGSRGGFIKQASKRGWSSSPDGFFRKRGDAEESDDGKDSRSLHRFWRDDLSDLGATLDSQTSSNDIRHLSRFWRDESSANDAAFDGAFMAVSDSSNKRGLSRFWRDESSNGAVAGSRDSDDKRDLGRFWRDDLSNGGTVFDSKFAGASSSNDKRDVSRFWRTVRTEHGEACSLSNTVYLENLLGSCLVRMVKETGVAVSDPDAPRLAGEAGTVAVERACDAASLAEISMDEHSAISIMAEYCCRHQCAAILKQFNA